MGSKEEPNKEKSAIFKCFLEKDLFAYKAFSFFIYGGFGAFYPFLPLYFKLYGLSSFQAGIIVGIRPLIQFIGAPFWSEIGERFQKKKSILMVGILAWILKAVLLWAVEPKYQTCTEFYTNTSTNMTKIYTYNVWDDTAGITNIEWKILTDAKKKEDQFIKNSVKQKGAAQQEEVIIVGAGRQKIGPLFNKIVSYMSHKHRQQKITSVVETFDKKVKTLIKNLLVVDTAEIQYIFLIFLMIIVIGEFLESPTYTLSDGSLLNRLGDERQYYGQIRLWGAVGWAVSTASAGAILYTTRSLMCAVLQFDYQVIFYVYFGFVSCAFFCVYWFSFQKAEDHERPTLRKALKVLCSLDHVVFLVSILFTGCCYGFLFHFVNWYIDDKKGSTLIMGAAGAARELGELTLFLLGGGCVRFLGNLNCMAVCLISYAACFYLYSIIVSPWMAVLLEALDGAVYGLVWSNSVNYMSSLGAPIGAVVIMQGKMTLLMIADKCIFFFDHLFFFF